MASEAFKSLSINDQRLLVGRIAHMHDAGYTYEEISNCLTNRSIELVKEAIEMVKKAKQHTANKESE